MSRPDGIYLDLTSSKPLTLSQIRKLKPGASIIVERENGTSTLFTCYRPPRRRNESPVQYYRRTRVVDDRFTHVHNGYYYCNPAHCKQRWKNKKTRDEHLTGAYALL